MWERRKDIIGLFRKRIDYEILDSIVSSFLKEKKEEITMEIYMGNKSLEFPFVIRAILS